MPHLGVAVRAQRQHRYRADAHQRQVPEHELGCVGQLQHHAVQRPDALAAQRHAQAGTGTVQVGVGFAARAGHQRHLVR